MLVRPMSTGSISIVSTSMMLPPDTVGSSSSHCCSETLMSVQTWGGTRKQLSRAGSSSMTNSVAVSKLASGTDSAAVSGARVSAWKAIRPTFSRRSRPSLRAVVKARQRGRSTSPNSR